jgi:hypothetical protein
MIISTLVWRSGSDFGETKIVEWSRVKAAKKVRELYKSGARNGVSTDRQKNYAIIQFNL